MRKYLLLAFSCLDSLMPSISSGFIPHPPGPSFAWERDATRCAPVRTRAFFGVPMPVFGVAAYLVLGLLILAENLSSQRLGRTLQYAVIGISGGGFLFSLYLTSLEAFVIHAWCAWCVTSAIVVTCIFVLSLFDLPRPLAPPESCGGKGEGPNTL